MDADINSQQFHSSITTTLKLTIYITFSFIVREPPHTSIPSHTAQLYCINFSLEMELHSCTVCNLCSLFVLKLRTVLHKSQIGSTILLPRNYSYRSFAAQFNYNCSELFAVLNAVIVHADCNFCSTVYRLTKNVLL